MKLFLKPSFFADFEGSFEKYFRHICNSPSAGFTFLTLRKCFGDKENSYCTLQTWFAHVEIGNYLIHVALHIYKRPEKSYRRLGWRGRGGSAHADLRGSASVLSLSLA